MTSSSRTLGALAFASALALGATACQQDAATSSSGAASSTTAHDAADVTFATDMLPHHAQAIAMVEMTAGRPLDPAVQQLADEIRAAQAPEITTMRGWLTDWHEPVPDASASAGDMGGMGDMDSAASPMPGMMTSQQMTSLQDASDADFQTQWLQLMLTHHEGAVAMARTEIADGRYQPAIDLARSIVSSQSEEIDTIKGLLD